MNKEQLTAEFEQVSGQLKSYILRITASTQDTEDIVQDTFIKASEKIDSFRGDSSVKTWIFTIASNLAKDNFRAKKRWTEDVTDICREKALSNPNYFPEVMQIVQTSPHGQFEIKEHINFCLTCISKSLPLEQQICILLKEVHGFKVSETAKILDKTEAMIKYYLHTSRTKLVDIFENRCALINKKGTCHQCSELNGIFNPKQNFEIEKNKIEMAKVAEKGDKEHLLDLRLQIMKEIDPFKSKGSDLQLHHLENNRKVMENFQKKLTNSLSFFVSQTSKLETIKMKHLFTFLTLIMVTNTGVAQNGKATTEKTTFHRETSVSIEIDADPAIVWALLTNASDYPRWNSTVTSIDGNIALGQKIILKSILDAKRTFKLKIKEFEPEKKMVWGDGQGKRVYTISKNDNGTLSFSMTERIGGLMFPLYAKMIPSFDESFEQFAKDLKKESEIIMDTK